jgi:hypothetical protein
MWVRRPYAIKAYNTSTTRSTFQVTWVGHFRYPASIYGKITSAKFLTVCPCCGVSHIVSNATISIPRASSTPSSCSNVKAFEEFTGISTVDNVGCSFKPPHPTDIRSDIVARTFKIASQEPHSRPHSSSASCRRLALWDRRKRAKFSSSIQILLKWKT